MRKNEAVGKKQKKQAGAGDPRSLQSQPEVKAGASITRYERQQGSECEELGNQVTK